MPARRVELSAMSSVKIYRFPKPFRRRQPPAPVVPVFLVNGPQSWFQCGGFTVLWAASFVAVILYLSGLAGVARDDRFYTGVLAAVWGFYFIHRPLLKVRALGPLLILAGRLLLVATVISFFGGIYWLILSHD
jgi:hypothetical protein